MTAKKIATIREFNNAQSAGEKKICQTLMREIDLGLPEAESRIWRAHPVWFIDGNPTVGYSKLKDCIRLMFWSGADFDEPALKPGTGKFKDASIRYTSAGEIDTTHLQRWLEKSKRIRWDYRDIQKRKGKLVRLNA